MKSSGSGMERDSNISIAIVPTAGIGHLIPAAEFAKRLVSRHGILVSLIVPTEKPPSSAEKSVLQSLPSDVHHQFLPPVPTDDIRSSSPDVAIETLISHVVVRSAPALLSALRSVRASALFVDLFGTDAFDLAEELGIPCYIFYPSTAASLWFFLHLPELDKSVAGEFRDMTQLVEIPGSTPLRGSELLSPTQDRKNEAYRWLLHHTKRYRMAKGIAVNSFPEMEAGPIKALHLERDSGCPRIYPVGPLVRSSAGSEVEEKNECLLWLDEQPRGSVLFISFGSGGALSAEQTAEVAMGLEQSRQRFLWVVRRPATLLNAAYFLHEVKGGEELDFFPDGFLDRVCDRSKVVTSWAPQTEVLKHAAVGGFLSHCGWNSTLESVVHGVPLIAWPLYAEQKMNAPFLTELLKVAIRPRADEDGIIRRSEIADSVRALMEGEEGKSVRRRMKTLQEAAAAAVVDGGSSTRALDDLARSLKSYEHY